LKDRNLEIPNLKFQIPNFSTLFEIWNLEFGIFIKMAKIKITQVKSGIDRSKTRYGKKSSAFSICRGFLGKINFPKKNQVTF